ncbi:hypothetical protein WICANDRAFT_105119 [Wickerhamomyces anomalus NRRL Y-366-8]|uniref:Uncharacterized protein n=1 Tax=Wickerhamomyces anomalus (strain ATCC 58044 / CBS 1984 / NCYC 433 / NRRL Y-366-8) TaxID=683960 RepID=A0A1E3P4I0_WICAA|nr:uncharacterized protein WICANDRAFT_105119 [Wickerhamomyces anomalus NRRL Y-366-8]ODQ60114.1 hypothetical protein WICANDRAFT_105119 [Wickerhamomyces anomalus NRRL Y-366-8]
MSGKSVKNGKPKLRKGAVGGLDIRDLIRKAQDEKHEKEDAKVEVDNEPNESDRIIAEEEEEEQKVSISKSLLKDSPVGELDQEAEDSDGVPLPRKKTEYEKYLKSKERDKQIRKYNEECIKEYREERAQMRARVRQRDHSLDEQETVSIEASPSKKVRFKF